MANQKCILSKFSFTNWKGFESGELYFDDLSLLIGQNGAGKTNALLALEFAMGMISNKSIYRLFDDDKFKTRLLTDYERGFSFELTLDFDENTKYTYSVFHGTLSGYEHITKQIISVQRKSDDWTVQNIFIAETSNRNLSISCVDFDGSNLLQCVCVDEDVDRRLATRSIFGVSDNILEPAYQKNPLIWRIKEMFARLPQRYALYVSDNDGLKNISTDDNFLLSESHIAQFLKYSKRPYLDHKKSFACYGNFLSALHRNLQALTGSDKQFEINNYYSPFAYFSPGGFSSGTTKAIAIIIAILIAPSGSLLIFENIDEKINPSKMKALVELLQKEGAERGLKILITTHSTALMDAMPDGSYLYTQVCYRSPETGFSAISSIGGLDTSVELLSRGSLGQNTTSE
ncbi:MAG TPA: AAA family ATPase, partial [Pyrinomonadaceae bacterium]|nr:AAA family ATPase [Pyrinomonadaceae bacterium]